MSGNGDYISREAVLRDWPLCDEPGDAYQFIRNFPAADVRPVVRGKWICAYDDETIVPIINGAPQGCCYCSVCGEWLGASDEYEVRGNFCPNCGADMRQEAVAW